MKCSNSSVSNLSSAVEMRTCPSRPVLWLDWHLLLGPDWSISFSSESEWGAGVKVAVGRAGTQRQRVCRRWRLWLSSPAPSPRRLCLSDNPTMRRLMSGGSKNGGRCSHQTDRASVRNWLWWEFCRVVPLFFPAPHFKSFTLPTELKKEMENNTKASCSSSLVGCPCTFSLHNDS